MRLRRCSSQWLITSAVFLASCSQGNPTRPTTPSGVAAISSESGTVGSHAVGDVKVGSGALDMVRLRMDRQSSSGASVLRQYANPGGVYRFEVGETIELWAEWNSSEVPGVPRFRVEWGDGTSDAIHCGPCLLTHRYARAGVYTVSASLDDRVSTTVTRTFALQNVAPPVIEPVTVCAIAEENEDATLLCPAGKTVASINFASYGTPNGTCGAFSIDWCHAPTSVSVVQTSCLGRNSCTVPATNDNFGDPCEGTFKALYIQATCQ